MMLFFYSIALMALVITGAILICCKTLEALRLARDKIKRKIRGY